MQARKFVHPGILHTTKSIERMRAQIADKEYPAYGSFELLKVIIVLRRIISLSDLLKSFQEMVSFVIQNQKWSKTLVQSIRMH